MAYNEPTRSESVWRSVLRICSGVVLEYQAFFGTTVEFVIALSTASWMGRRLFSIKSD